MNKTNDKIHTGSNRSEQSVEEADDKLHQLETLIKYMPGAVAMFDRNMCYLVANDSWYQQYQLEGKRIIGHSHYDIFPQIKEMQEWLELHQRALAGESLTSELDSFEQTSDTTYLRWKLEPWYENDDSIGGIIMFTEVITEEVLEAQRLRAHDNVLRTLLNEMEDGFAHARIVRDKEGNPINWQYLNVGRGLGKYVPVPPETLVGKTVTDAIPGAIEADPKWLDIFNEVAVTGKSREIEEHSDVLDTWFRMNIYSPAEDEFATIFRDTTEKNKALQKLESLNELFTGVSELARIGAWEIDVETQKCFWSDMVYQIHEVEPGIEIKVEEGINFFHPDHQKILQDAVNHAIENRESYDLELKLITAKGGELWVRTIGKAIFEGDKVVRLRGLFQDINIRVNREEEIRSLNQNLQEKVEERTKDLRKTNEELESFSYSISHDLRAPLRAINGYSEAFMQDHGSNLTEDAKKYMDRIAANSKKMGMLIDDLLEFSRLNRRKVNYKPVDLGAVVEGLIDDLFSSSGEIIEVSSLPTIPGDLEMINQVFSNVLSNAIKYSSNERSPKVLISHKEEKDAYLISIKDNGVGFNMDYYDKLFKVFERLHGEFEFEGTGVGLSLCDKIMKAHDGEIFAESKEGVGSTFYLRFNKT